jgi:putative spermidine/putrescine transport system permease protein
MSTVNRRYVDWGRLALQFVVAAILIFEVAPLIVAVLASFTSSEVMEFPPSQFSLRSYGVLAQTVAGAPGTRRGLTDALSVSFRLAAVTCLVSVCSGTVAAYAIWKRASKLMTGLKNLVLLPLIFPEFVTGIALVLLLSRLHIGNQFYRLIIGHVIISLPYVVLIVGATLASYDRSLDEAAMSLGASPARSFFEITLPLIRRGIISSGLIVFIISLNQFNISYFVSGAEATPLPIWLLNILIYRLDTVMAALGAVLVGLTFLAAVLLDKVMGIRQVLRF